MNLAPRRNLYRGGRIRYILEYASVTPQRQFFIRWCRHCPIWNRFFWSTRRIFPTFWSIQLNHNVSWGWARQYKLESIPDGFQTSKNRTRPISLELFDGKVAIFFENSKIPNFLEIKFEMNHSYRRAFWDGIYLNSFPGLIASFFLNNV